MSISFGILTFLVIPHRKQWLSKKSEVKRAHFSLCLFFICQPEFMWLAKIKPITNFWKKWSNSQSYPNKMFVSWITKQVQSNSVRKEVTVFKTLFRFFYFLIHMTFFHACIVDWLRLNICSTLNAENFKMFSLTQTLRTRKIYL